MAHRCLHQPDRNFNTFRNWAILSSNLRSRDVARLPLSLRCYSPQAVAELFFNSVDAATGLVGSARRAAAADAANACCTACCCETNASSASRRSLTWPRPCSRDSSSSGDLLPDLVPFPFRKLSWARRRRSSSVIPPEASRFNICALGNAAATWDLILPHHRALPQG